MLSMPSEAVGLAGSTALTAPTVGVNLAEHNPLGGWLDVVTGEFGDHLDHKLNRAVPELEICSPL